MKIVVSPNRIYLNSKPPECSLGKQRNSEPMKPLRGGMETKSPGKKTAFIVTSDKSSLYYAPRPCMAAIKGYNSSTKLYRYPEFNKLLIESFLLKKGFPEKEIEDYLIKCSECTLGSTLLISVRKPHQNKVQKYSVHQEINYNPNKHEVKKGIVKVTKTQKVLEKKRAQNK